MCKKMKILMIAPTPFFSDRGCHVRILEEAKALQRLGHKVHICTYHLGRDMEEISTHRIPKIPWYKKRAAGPSWHKPYLDIFLFFKSFSTCLKVKPDLIHAHLHEGAFVGFFLSKILKIPMVFDCQGSLAGELVDHGFAKKDRWLYRFFFKLEKLINTSADHIITSSTPTSNLLTDKFLISKEKVTPVGDGVDVEKFYPLKRDNKDLGDMGLPEGKIIVVFLGAMTKYQGVDLLLNVIKNLSLITDDIHFLLMGYPSEKYEETAKALGLEPFVTFTGKIDYDRANDFLGLGEIAVSPKLSRSEANGKLFNYMACGLPTVVFDTSVNREIMGETGLFAEYADADDFARQIKSLVKDRELHIRLSFAVRQKAVNEYSWDTIGRKIEKVYEGILKA